MLKVFSGFMQITRTLILTLMYDIQCIWNLVRFSCSYFHVCTHLTPSLTVLNSDLFLLEEIAFHYDNKPAGNLLIRRVG